MISRNHWKCDHTLDDGTEHRTVVDFDESDGMVSLENEYNDRVLIHVDDLIKIVEDIKNG